MKTGILLTNLGTPDEPTKPALKRYLAEFLSDPRVVDPPNKLIWWLALNLVILNIRPKKSAVNYAKIWNSLGWITFVEYYSVSTRRCPTGVIKTVLKPRI